MRRILRTLLTLILCVAMITVGIMFGPQLYQLLFGGSNATWVSERFSEQLTEMRDLIVLRKTITGQENISTDAWLIGTVQKIVVPYSFSANFSVNLLQASVQYNEVSNEIQVFLPVPTVEYYKLIVDEDNVKKYDLLYPLTADRYAEIKLELEQKLYDEVTNDAELKDSAWASAVSEMESLYQDVLSANGSAETFQIRVIQAEPKEGE